MTLFDQNIPQLDADRHEISLPCEIAGVLVGESLSDRQRSGVMLDRSWRIVLHVQHVANIDIFDREIALPHGVSGNVPDPRPSGRNITLPLALVGLFGR